MPSSTSRPFTNPINVENSNDDLISNGSNNDDSNSNSNNSDDSDHNDDWEDAEQDEDESCLEDILDRLILFDDFDDPDLEEGENEKKDKDEGKREKSEHLRQSNMEAFLISDDFQIGQPVLSDEEWVVRILNPEIKRLEELQKTKDPEYVPKMKGRAKWNDRVTAESKRSLANMHEQGVEGIAVQ